MPFTRDLSLLVVELVEVVFRMQCSGYLIVECLGRF